MKQQLPSYPLFVKDPFFSIWMPNDVLNKNNTANWQGQEKIIYGVVRTEDTTYSFLGDVPNTIKMKQTSIEITSFTTKYSFESKLFDLDIEFISPMPLNNLDLLSSPVCIFKYNIRPKTKNLKTELTVFLHEHLAYNQQHHPNSKVRGDVMKHIKFDVAYFGLDEQKVLSHSADVIGADWGYYFLTGEKCYYTTQEGVNKYIESGQTPEYEKDGTKYIASVNTSLKGEVYIAFDDIVSIYYYGQLLKGYYFRNGKTIIDALNETDNNLEKIEKELAIFDNDLVNRSSKYGTDYLHILRASLRQSIAGHKLVQDQKGRKLFLSKECGSDGCIATVDVSYPSSPLYFLYNPELVLGMLYPIFEFAQMDIWDYPFAPHDAGVYPYVNGQFYGIKEQANGRYHREVGYNKADFGVLPKYYIYPKGSDLYRYEMQMPVEECGNMLILSALLLKMDYGHEKLRPYFELLTQWANYLYDKGLVPENQLCTDDFAGHLDKNINLAIKATVALAAYQEIADQLDIKIDPKFRKEAESRAQKISSYEGHIPLTFDSSIDTYSLKYNLYADLILETNLFEQKVIEKELKVYEEKFERYGIPLDTRNGYTKSDWLIWVAALSKDSKFQSKVIHSIHLFLEETNERIPFSDWYESNDASMPLKHLHFRNRTVQGGIFALLLKDKIQGLERNT